MRTMHNDGLQKQSAIINNFAKENAIKINSSKTELVKFSLQVSIIKDVELGSQSLTAQPAAKCLGYWWHSSFSPATSIEENILKACRAYFALGAIGAFQGRLNPLSERSIFSYTDVTTGYSQSHCL